MDADVRLRVQRDLGRLGEGGITAVLVEEPIPCVVYRSLPTAGEPATTDVIVRIPEGYPAVAIDLAGLPSGSPLQLRVAGGNNPQGILTALDHEWTLSSYHPHQWSGNGWDQSVHGFHTYVTYLLTWLKRLI